MAHRSSPAASSSPRTIRASSPRCATCSRPTASTPSRPANSACRSRKRPATTFARQRAHQGAGRRAGVRPAGLRRRFRSRGRCARRRARHLFGALGRARQGFRARDGSDRRRCCASAARSTPRQRTAHFVSALCVAWPDGHRRGIRGARRRHAGLAAARRRRASATIRCSCPTDMTRTFGEMTSEEKHGLPPRGKGLSHRARAFVKLAEACLERTLSLQPRKPSASMCTGRSACRSARIATSTAMCAMPAIDEARFVRAFAAEIAATAARAPGRTVSTHLLRRRHAVADAARDRRARFSMRSRKHWTVAPDVEVTLEANPTSVEADALSRLSRGRRQPRVARRAGARRCVAEARSAGCTRRRKRSTPSRSRARRSSATRSI